MDHEGCIRYRIDANDVIVSVDNSWHRFAEANDGAELTGDHVLGRLLWDFVADDTTCQLYQQMLVGVRRGQPVQFTLRCDAPSCRRLLEMTIRPEQDGTVEFATRALKVEERDSVPLLARETARSGDWLHICAWCNRINLDNDDWVEVEEAAARLRLFELRLMPQLTHGICPRCRTSMMATITKTGAQV